MQPTHIFTNGCSFLTQRPKEGVMTHVGMELAKQMELQEARHLGAGGRGNKRLSVTTKVWCQKNPALVKKCFFVIGITSGLRIDYPRSDNHKKHKFPELNTAWNSYKPHENIRTEKFFKHYVVENAMCLDQMAHYESLEATLNLQNFFKVQKYPYVMYKTLPDPQLQAKRRNTHKDIRLLESLIDKDRYFNYGTSHLEYTENNNQHCAPDDHHPSPDGHRDWATQLKEFIDANDLRTI